MLKTTAFYLLGAVWFTHGPLVTATGAMTSNFALMDAAIREILAPIVDGDTIDLADYGSPNDVRVVYDPTEWSNVKSAKILVDGDGVCRREKNAPRDGSPWIRSLSLSPSGEPIELVAHGYTRKRCVEPPSYKEMVTFTLVDSSDEPCPSALEFTETTRLLEAVDVILAGGTVPEGPIECWHVGKITSFSNLLWRGDYDAPGLAEFNYDLGNWNVSSGTDFSAMFSGARSFNQDIGGWDVSKSTSFASMFNDAFEFNQDIGGWDVSRSTSFASMFTFTFEFNQDIGGWDVSRSTSFGGMFNVAFAFNQDISEWDVSSGTEFDFMFGSADAFNQDISGWDVSSGTDFSLMFQAATVFNQDIGRWDVSRGTSFRRMFGQQNAFNQDLSGWDVSSGLDFGRMFQDATAFNQDVSSWDVSRGTNFAGMFDGATAFDQDLCAWGDDFQPGAIFSDRFTEFMFTGTSCPSFDLPPSHICYPCS